MADETQMYKVTLEIEVPATDPLAAAKLAAKWLEVDANRFIYDVDETEGEESELKKFTVDLSEEDEDAVLSNN